MAANSSAALDDIAARERPILGLGSERLAFIVWGKPSQGPRSQVLARELGIRSLHFVHTSARRGILSAPFRYMSQTVETVLRLLKDRPQVVFVQSPPSLAVLSVYLYAKMTGARYLVDAHSTALLMRIWTRPRWLHRMLVRNAITTMVTNEHFGTMIEAEGGHAFVLRDVPSQFGKRTEYPLQGAFRIAVVNTFAEDEPLEEILSAARELPEIDFYITGDKQQARAGLLEHLPVNAHLTGFLPEPRYYGLLGSVDGVMCLTTREHTMQRGACEALSLGRPIITSDTHLLQSYFDRGTVHVKSTAQSIRDGVLRLHSDLARYQIEILDLQDERRREWQEKRQALAALVRQAISER